MRSLSAILCFFYSCAVFASAIMEVNVDHDAKAFSIKLPANPTTGFRWVIDSYDDKHFQKTAEKYLATSPRRIGSGGQMCFTFERKKSLQSLHETTLVFKYQRAWEEKPVDVQTVVVHFNAKK